MIGSKEVLRLVQTHASTSGGEICSSCARRAVEPARRRPPQDNPRSREYASRRFAYTLNDKSATELRSNAELDVPHH